MLKVMNRNAFMESLLSVCKVSSPRTKRKEKDDESNDTTTTTTTATTAVSEINGRWNDDVTSLMSINDAVLILQESPLKLESNSDGGITVVGLTLYTVVPYLCLLDVADRLRKDVDIRDRTYRLRTIRRCFTGEDAIAALIKAHQCIEDASTALALGTELLRLQLITPKTHRSSLMLLQDKKNALYQFTDVPIAQLVTSSTVVTLSTGTTKMTASSSGNADGFHLLKKSKASSGKSRLLSRYTSCDMAPLLQFPKQQQRNNNSDMNIQWDDLVSVTRRIGEQEDTEAHVTLIQNVTGSAIVMCVLMRGDWQLSVIIIVAVISIFITRWLGLNHVGAKAMLEEFLNKNSSNESDFYEEITQRRNWKEQLEQETELRVGRDEYVDDMNAPSFDDSNEDDSGDDDDNVGEEIGASNENVDTLLARLHADLDAAGFPEAREVYSDGYMKKILAVQGRSYSHSLDKVLSCLRWHRESNIDSIIPTSLERVLSCGSLYWNGYDIEGHPILWVRSSRKDWASLNIQEEIQMHILMLEFGISIMPRGIHEFTVVADASGLGLRTFDFRLMGGLLRLVTKCYPDRLHALYVGPTNIAVVGIFRALKPLMPKRLTDKIVLMRKPYIELQPVLANGEHSIPQFFDGHSMHSETFLWDDMVKDTKSNLIKLIK